MNNIKGFSLVELMVAVGIVGVMSLMAVPKYQKYKVDASRAEAQTSLTTLYTLQQLHYTDKGYYGVLNQGGRRRGGRGRGRGRGGNDLGFPISKDQRYKYKSTVSSNLSGQYPTPGSGAIYFKATAVSKKVLGSCAKKPKKDMWCINHDKVLANKKKEPQKPCKPADVQNGGCS